MSKLNEKFISNFAPEAGRKDRLVFDSECRGLGVRATQAGNRVFLVQWVDPATKQKRREPLGVWGQITLEQARTACRIWIGKVASGIDPAAERSAQAAAAQAATKAAADAKAETSFTLKDLIDNWSTIHLAGMRASYAREAPRALKVAFTSHLNRPAMALDHAMVMAAVDRLMAEGKAPLAARVISYGRAAFGWTVQRRRLAANPFTGLPSIAGGSPARDRVLSDDEIGRVWRAATAIGEPYGPLVRVLLLTGQRRDEIAGMAWSEISADGMTWVLPADRAKNHKQHIVHLSKPVREILAALPRINAQDLVFGDGPRPLSGFSNSKAALDAAMARERLRAGETDQSPGWVLHDFRRSCVTWMARHGIAPHVADRVLNHTGGTISGVAAIYQRNQFLDERRSALDAWASHVMHCAEGKETGGNVVQLERVAG